MNSGIYLIENLINGKKYIGSAINIRKRWYQHKYMLNKNNHENLYLQNSWNKYGESNFKFSILEEVIPNELINREQYYIDHYDVCNENCGYNLAPNAGNTLGFKFSDESKLKMSLLKKNKPSTRKNYRHTKETKEKIRESKKGKNVGRKLSEETKEKQRKPHGAMSETTKKKLSDWRKGLIPSQKTGKFITNDVKNILLTEEVIKKTKIINKNNTNRLNHNCSNETKTKISKSNEGKNNGENNGMSITNKIEVALIRSDYNNGMSISQLQTKYDKKYMFVYKIVKRITWNWLDDSSFCGRI